ncbi:MAG: bacteriohemerythrin [Rhodoferax sp.]|nr:bacteriohemerythrin [Rhodoferax sp.]MCF8209640.1 bacteriohemerythrin [Rhodoferax sp.]
MAGKISPIVWNDTFATGVTTIDDQHKILVNMLNEANERLDESTTRDVLLEIVKDLISYALYHFDEEEELMIHTRYPQTPCQQHMEEHRAFSERVTTIQRELVQGTLIHRDELIGYLNNWLINHIMGTDKRFESFVLASEG